MTTTRSDIVRQVTVAVSALLAIAGGLYGSGIGGGQDVDEMAGGALTDNATTIAPDGPAFSIWSVIYLGLIAYAVWQFFPAQRDAERHRRLGYLVAASMLLNAAWILVVQIDQLLLSVVVIVALLAVLCVAFVIAFRTKSLGPVDAVITDGTVGLYLGWVSVATIANIAAVLAANGFDGGPLNADMWGTVLALAAGVVGASYALVSGGRLAPALSLCWGLLWVGIGRLTGELESTPTAIAAFCAIALVAIVTVVARLRSVSRDA